jgi:hypothetical protein
MGLDEIEERMDWLMKNEPRNETERRLCALFSVVMMTQLVDDWCDMEIDEGLGLYTLATGLMDISGGNEPRARKLRDEEIERYFRRGSKMGVTWTGFVGAKSFFAFFKQAMLRFPDKLGGRREKLSI